MQIKAMMQHTTRAALNAQFGDEFNKTYKELVPYLRSVLKGKLSWR